MNATTTTYEIELDNYADEYDWEWANERIAEWAVEADVSHFYIEGMDMTWRRLSGHIVTPFDKLAEAFSLNGEYRVVFTITEGDTQNLKAVRYSHDEPCGASFIVRPATEEEIEEW